MSEKKSVCQDVREYCPIEVTSAIVGGKWKSLILFRLLETGTVRFNALHRSLPCVTRRILTLQLRELEKDGVIHREVYHQVPPRVEYSLTALGEKLEPALRLLREWGQTYLDEKSKANP